MPSILHTWSFFCLTSKEICRDDGAAACYYVLLVTIHVPANVLLFINVTVSYKTLKKWRFPFQGLARVQNVFQWRFLHNNCGVII